MICYAPKLIWTRVLSLRKSSKDAKFGQCHTCKVPTLLWAEPMSRWVECTFKVNTNSRSHQDIYWWPGHMPPCLSYVSPRFKSADMVRVKNCLNLQFLYKAYFWSEPQSWMLNLTCYIQPWQQIVKINMQMKWLILN